MVGYLYTEGLEGWKALKLTRHQASTNINDQLHLLINDMVTAEVPNDPYILDPRSTRHVLGWSTSLYESPATTQPDLTRTVSGPFPP